MSSHLGCFSLANSLCPGAREPGLGLLPIFCSSVTIREGGQQGCPAQAHSPGLKPPPARRTPSGTFRCCELPLVADFQGRAERSLLSKEWRASAGQLWTLGLAVPTELKPDAWWRAPHGKRDQKVWREMPCSLPVSASPPKLIAPFSRLPLSFCFYVDPLSLTPGPPNWLSLPGR